MKTFSFFSVFILAALLLNSCAPTYVQDPNSSVIVTVKYEDGPETIASSRCQVGFDCCDDKKGAECATLLYNRAKSFIQNGGKQANRSLYTSAVAEYMQALSLLKRAKIILVDAKTTDFTDWQVAVTLGLEEKIKDDIRLCERKISTYQWRN